LRTVRLVVLSLLTLCLAAPAQPGPGNDVVLKTMQRELTRSFNALNKTSVPPYFLSYQLTDNQAYSVISEFGALVSSSDRKTRLLDLDLRVGDYKLDNTHPIQDSNFAMTQFGQFSSAIPIEDDSDALAVALWLETDRHYKYATQRFEAVKTNGSLRTAKSSTKDEDDFSKAAVESYSEPVAEVHFDRTSWEKKVRDYGKPFRGDPNIKSASVSATGEIETRRYVNSDGSVVRLSMPLYRLTISASIRAADGEILPLHRDWMSFTPEGMPSDEEVQQTVTQMISTLQALREAPVEEPYTGPAILSGRASAVFFHEIFGHRIEGDRLKNDDDAQTFKKRINQSVLPPFLSVYSDPTARRIGNKDLVGYYPFDDEGVKARRVAVVQNGVFRSFLTSRTPITGFAASNGHGRRQQGYTVEARQSNLIVESTKKSTRAELIKTLIARVKVSKKPYGLLFEDIQGGFTFTTRTMPNAFTVMPTMVYRVYPDGKTQLVRGLDLIGTPLIAFSKISATDDETGIFNGVCGAESGWVPVSAVAPGILVDQIEVQRKEKSRDREPILPDPSEKPDTKVAVNQGAK
jgi:TldD protein